MCFRVCLDKFFSSKFLKEKINKIKQDSHSVITYARKFKKVKNFKKIYKQSLTKYISMYLHDRVYIFRWLFFYWQQNKKYLYITKYLGKSVLILNIFYSYCSVWCSNHCFTVALLLYILYLYIYIYLLWNKHSLVHL